MADLFLHLPFARRLRFAEGLHPLAAEAIGRRPALVLLGASLSGLPGNERRGMSWLRRLFSRGGEAARWQKLLAPTPGHPHVKEVLSLLSADDSPIGPLARLAIGLGALSHEVLEEKVGPLTSSLQGDQRAAVERAQARLWLQASVPRHLEAEWKPVLELVEGDANKRALVHVDRALKRVHGSAPGEAALARWIKGLAAEVQPLVDAKGAAGALPPSLSVADHDARGPHYEQAGFVEKTQAALAQVVFLANRIADAFQTKDIAGKTLAEALGGDNGLPEPTPAEIAKQREKWLAWVKEARVATSTRGRNPKPAFAEGEGPAHGHGASPEHRLASITKVMSLSDLPPETEDTGAPPLPEASGPLVAPPIPPTQTQEVSLAQIEAEARAAGQSFPTPAHTQEISLAQIEAEGFAAPAHTQEVSAAQLVETKAASITQPISVDQIAEQNAADEKARQAAAATSASEAPAPPAPGSSDGKAAPPHTGPEAVLAPPAGVSAPTGDARSETTSAHTDGVDHASNGVNGSSDTPLDPPAGVPREARPEDGPPRE
jgi:hypothetical protein